MPLSIISNMIKWLPTPHVLYSWPYSPTPNANVIPILWWWHVGAPAPHAHSIQNSWHIFHLRPCNEIKRAISHGSRIIKVHKKFVLQFVRVICRGNLSGFFNLLSACASFSQRESFNRNSGNEKVQKCFPFCWRILIFDMLLVSLRKITTVWKPFRLRLRH